MDIDKLIIKIVIGRKKNQLPDFDTGDSGYLTPSSSCPKIAVAMVSPFVLSLHSLEYLRKETVCLGHSQKDYSGGGA